MTRLHRWLVSPRLPIHLAILAILLSLPALGVGWQIDDYFQRMIMLGRAAHDVQPMEAFALMKGDNVHLQEYVEWGAFPWWSADNLRLAFFRYVTVATVWLDYKLWPNSAPLMHAHSLFWLGALVAAAAALYRRLMGATLVAGLAGLLYAVDEAHFGAAAWLANRNALLATFFGILALLAHDRWRRGGRSSEAWTGPVLLALGLASGEMALATVGYLIAFALFLDPAGRARGFGALRYHGGVLAVWVGIYRLGGFGARGSGVYLDPISDMTAYLSLLPERIPFLLLGQWTVISADVGWLLPEARARSFWLLAVALIAILALLLWPLLRRDETARFWAFGMLASLLPVAATFPSNRLLFMAGLGGMGLLAQLLTDAFARESPVTTRAWQPAARAASVLLIVMHLVLAPLLAPFGARFVGMMGEPTKKAVASLPSDSTIERKDLVIVNSPDYLTFVTLISAVRSVEETPFPPRIRALSAGPVPIVLTRIDEHAVRVRIEGGIYAGPLGELYRSRSDSLPPGRVVELVGMTAMVVTDDGNGVPVEIEYRFDRALEDPGLHWVRWGEDGTYLPFAIPAVGERVHLPAPIGAMEQIAELFPFDSG